MAARVGEWIELSFWHIAVGVLTRVRPFRRGLEQGSQALEAAPATAFLPHGWVIAVSGWILGLAIGVLLAVRLF